MSINMMDLSIIKPVIFSWKKVSVSIEKNARITSIKCAHAIVKRVLIKGRRYSYVDIIVILLFSLCRRESEAYARTTCIS